MGNGRTDLAENSVKCKKCGRKIELSYLLTSEILNVASKNSMCDNLISTYKSTGSVYTND